jgi:hypothetical protein
MLTATKSLNELEVGDKIVRKGGVTFERALEVTEVVRSPEGGIFLVKLEGGRFWPFDGVAGRAKATEIEVLA